MRVRLSNVQLIVGGLEGDALWLDDSPPAVPMRVRLSNVQLIVGGLEGDVEQLGAAPPPVSVRLPPGYDTDPGVAFGMLQSAVNLCHLDAIAVQRHGQQIVDALNETWPGLDAYVDRKSDAVMWPGFGDVDVTIDSGKGGWAFQPGHNARYEPDRSKR
jgi:hypothetical protein